MPLVFLGAWCNGGTGSFPPGENETRRVQPRRIQEGSRPDAFITINTVQMVCLPPIQHRLVPVDQDFLDLKHTDGPSCHSPDYCIKDENRSTRSTKEDPRTS